MTGPTSEAVCGSIKKAIFLVIESPTINVVRGQGNGESTECIRVSDRPGRRIPYWLRAREISRGGKAAV